MTVHRNVLLLLLCSLLVVPAAMAASPNVVISQVYGGGGNGGATLKNDFIELFNRGTSAVVLTGWSVQYTSTSGATWQTTPLSGTIQPGQYYLVQEAAGAGGTVALPTPDATGNISMGATGGKVALAASTTALSASCPTGAVDLVGFGGANCSETAPTAAPSNTTAVTRKGSGCTETDNNSSDFATGAPAPRNSATAIHACGEAPPPPPPPPPPVAANHIVISQIYGGGGNGGATYHNDYIQLYNPTNTSVDVGGWSIQYGSASGTTWQPWPIGGVIRAGEYYLISLASGGAVGSSLPTSNVTGDLNLSATSGKVALVSNGNPLDGCPAGDATVIDLVGFGSANCSEGGSNAPAGSNTQALFRANGGLTDSDVNGADFTAAAPDPRRTADIVELGPYVFTTDPRPGAATAPRDATIIVTFTELVDLTPGWFSISCVSTGFHNDFTLAGGGRTYEITPNVNFAAGEQCSVTVFKNAVHDSDFDDAGLNTDTLPADFVWTFKVATGTAPPYAPETHLTMGNPSGAEADTFNFPNNYLMMKPEYALSYNRDRGTPNWVSWHLSDEWIGTLTRIDTFRQDPAVPPEWYRVRDADYNGSGYDRGHMTPNADRDKETSIPINQATFLMSNIIPQAADNNQGPWASLENYLRTLTPANELYIVAGPAGTATGADGAPLTIASTHVTVPASTWKAVLVLPKSAGDDVHNVNAATRTIAVIMPNIKGIRDNRWESYLVSVDQIEVLTGYDLFANLPDAIENAVEAGVNGTNPPGVENQTVTTPEDVAKEFTLAAANPTANPLTYTIVGPPAHGTVSGSGLDVTYTPLPNFNGTDSFSYTVTDGSKSSNTGTVTVNITAVDDPLLVTADDKQMYFGDPLPALTASYSGFVLSDTQASIVTGAPLLTTAATSTSAPGTYTIAVAPGSLVTPGYAVVPVAGTLTIAGPLAKLQSIIAEVVQLKSSTNGPQAQAIIDRVLAELADATAGPWSLQTFTSTKNAVTQLGHLIDGNKPLAPASVVDAIVARILSTDRAAAVLAVLTAAPGDAVDRANAEITHGDADVAAKRYESAVGHYRTAFNGVQ